MNRPPRPVATDFTADKTVAATVMLSVIREYPRYEAGLRRAANEYLEGKHGNNIPAHHLNETLARILAPVITNCAEGLMQHRHTGSWPECFGFAACECGGPRCARCGRLPGECPGN